MAHADPKLTLAHLRAKEFGDRMAVVPDHEQLAVCLRYMEAADEHFAELIDMVELMAQAQYINREGLDIFREWVRTHPAPIDYFLAYLEARERLRVDGDTEGDQA